MTNHGRPTDHRNLDLWDLNLDVAFGRAAGKIIWQPRVLAWFTDRQFAGVPLPGRFEGMTEPEVYRALGCSNRLYHYNECFQPVEPVEVKRVHQRLEGGRHLDEIHTPVGTVSRVQQPATTTWYSATEKHWVESAADLRVFTWLADHSDWRWDQDHFNQTQAEWARVGAPTMFMPRVNVQHLYLDLMGVEAGVYAIYEWGSTIADFFHALQQNHLRLIDRINESPIQLINFGDNLHCETLSPSLYEEYVLPAYTERCDRLHHAGKFVSSHWDGKVKALLPFAQCSGLDAIEAITPIPQGDVTLEETRAALGNDLVLLDGIPAVLFDETYPEEELIACTEKVIALFAPNLILGISDEMSSQGDLERISLVGKIVDDYNAAVSAS